MPEDPWAEIDAYLFQHNRLAAIRSYRSLHGCGLNEAAESTSQRRRHLWETMPDRFFVSREPKRDIALQRLQAVTDPVLVIEAYWDEDSFQIYLDLMAIAPAPTGSPFPFVEHHLVGWTSDEVIGGHPRNATYTEILQRCVAEATTLGEELASLRSAGFYLVSSTPNFDKRWWDSRLS